MDRMKDLMMDAMQADDYKFRVNFLLAALISEEANDTDEKIEKNKKALNYFLEFSSRFSGDQEKEEFLYKTSKTVREYLSNI